jgi:hypothetical protein
MGKALIITIVVIVIVVIGIVALVMIGGGPKCPECPESGSYSQCNDQAIKTRTNYKCGEETNFECESFTEETQCATEIKLSGSVDGTISPSIDEKVKGVIKVEVKNVPEGTKIVAYYLSGGNLPAIGTERMPSLATDNGDVWVGMIDTSEYENGLYDLAVVTNNKEALEGDPQAYAQGKIVISN